MQVAPLARTSLALLLAVHVHAAAPQEAADKRLTLEEASGRGQDVPSFSGRAANARWAQDGVHVALARGEGSDSRTVWIDPATGEETAPPPDEGAKSDQAWDDQDTLVRALQSIEGVDAERAKELVRGAGQRREAESGERAAVFQSEGQLWFYVRDAAGAERVGVVPAEEGPFELMDVAQDGGTVVWVRDYDLRSLDTRTGNLVTLTDDGSEETLNGKLDWVYQEEVYGRGDFKGHWLSNDGRTLAYLALDESPVHEFTVIDHIEEGTFRVKPEIVNYPVAGDPNPTVELRFARCSDGATVKADLSRYDGQEFLIVRVGWTPDGRCLAYVQDRIQTWCDVLVVDPVTGAVHPLLREESPTWTERPAWPEFLADGSFLWQSERTGTNHVYRYAADGTLMHPVTSGPWTVHDLFEVDEAGGQLYFGCSEGGATDRNLYRVGLDGEGFTRLTQDRGTHLVDLRPDKAFFLDRHSSLQQPESVRLCRTSDGAVLQVLDVAEIPAQAAGYELARWELFEVPARDGTLLDVAVQKPIGFDPQRSYPVWIPTYSGPDAPTVRNRWNGGGWNQFLAENDVLVVQVNVRTASNKGRAMIGQCYKQLGVQELADIEDVVDWITANPWADAARVGITGYSYGGFMTAYSLLNSKKFALGIAGGGVYDWAMYDTIYTERYMSTPQRNPEGYAKTSCLNKAADLHGYLYMHHGVMDDNVHFQNVLQMAYALQKAGMTNWGMMAYPQTRHGIRDRSLAWHAREVEWSLILEHLRPNVRPAMRVLPAVPVQGASTQRAGGGR